jgi:hypothetical protein
VLAKRTVINIQRSSHQWHEFFIQIAANTPSEKIWEVSDATMLELLLHDMYYMHTAASVISTLAVVLPLFST